MTQAALGLGKMPRGGRVIHIGSVGSKIEAPGIDVYGASKAAQDFLTSSWAREVSVFLFFGDLTACLPPSLSILPNPHSLPLSPFLPPHLLPTHQPPARPQPRNHREHSRPGRDRLGHERGCHRHRRAVRRAAARGEPRGEARGGRGCGAVPGVGEERLDDGAVCGGGCGVDYYCYLMMGRRRRRL